MAVRRNPGGRPSKFTTSAALALITALCQDATLERAADLNALAFVDFSHKVKKGRNPC